MIYELHHVGYAIRTKVVIKVSRHLVDMQNGRQQKGQQQNGRQPNGLCTPTGREQRYSECQLVDIQGKGTPEFGGRNYTVIFNSRQ